MIIPNILVAEMFSFKKSIDPIVVNKKTTAANMGYDLERSLKVSTLSQIKKDNPYKQSPIQRIGVDAAFSNSGIRFALFPETPPNEITAFLRRILAVTLNVTLINSS